MNLKEVEKAVARIQASLFKNSNSYSIGMLKSNFRGSGLTFKEHQVYNHGDDVRFIDWKLLAKMDTPYIKTFEEERNVELTVILDASNSMTLGYKSISKLQAAIEITGLLYLLAGETGDSVEVVIVGEKLTTIKKSRGRNGIIAFVSELEKLGILNENGKVDRNYFPLQYPTKSETKKNILKYVQMRREVIVLTDFNDFLEEKDLNDFMKKKNFHAVQVSSPLDDAKLIPYRLFGFCEENGILKKVNEDLKSLRKLEDIYKKKGKRFKKVSVEDRYLEEFIKEMI